MNPTDDLTARLTLKEYPRAAGYDPRWVLDNLMGPNVLWLTESLTEVVALEPGMRVLDLGCGKAVSSIFLAREFGVQVWATDLWIPAAENLVRIREAGQDRNVFPIYGEAHALPFAPGFFDAMVSMDAYHYFGTDDLYIDYCSRLVRDGGQIGIVVPGLTHELTDGVPTSLAPYWNWDFCSFHSAEWWRRHWDKSGKVRVESAEMITDGWKQWLLWLETARQFGYPSSDSEAMLHLDQGETLAFVRVVGRKSASQAA